MHVRLYIIYMIIYIYDYIYIYIYIYIYMIAKLCPVVKLSKLLQAKPNQTVLFPFLVP